jgi:maltose 6'-phosphate phosphatase
MKLLTLNCHSWQEENQLEKIKILAKTIMEKSYDVVALQEVSQSMDSENVNHLLKKDNYLLILLDELRQLGVTEYQYTWDFSHIGFEVFEEGLAILTKHPIIENRSFYVTSIEDKDNWKARRIVGAKVRIHDEEVSFYSCHLGWWKDDEEPFQGQADFLYEKLKQDKKCFLMGDFNNPASIKNEGYDYLLTKGLLDTYQLADEKDEGYTVVGKIAGWDQNKQGLRIDYIFSNLPVKVLQSKVIFNGEHYPVISDHFGVEIEVEM